MGRGTAVCRVEAKDCTLKAFKVKNWTFKAEGCTIKAKDCTFKAFKVCTFKVKNRTFKAKDCTVSAFKAKAEIKDLAQRPTANVSARLKEKYDSA